MHVAIKRATFFWPRIPELRRNAVRWWQINEEGAELLWRTCVEWVLEVRNRTGIQKMRLDSGGGVWKDSDLWICSGYRWWFGRVAATTP